MSGEAQSPERRKAYATAAEIGLTRDERLELAEYLLRRDVGSWAELDETQITRLLDALEGWGLVTALLDLRPE